MNTLSHIHESRSLSKMRANARHRATALLASAAQRGLVLPCYAAGGATSLSLISDGRIDAPLAALAWLLVYASYTLDTLSEVGRFDDALSSKRSKVVSGRVGPMAGALCAFAATLALSWWHSGPSGALLLLIFPASVAVYGSRLLPCLGRTGLRLIRIKDIPFAKSFYTAFFWGLMGTYCALLLRPTNGMGLAIFAFLLFGVRDFVNTVFCDLKDIERDCASGIMTFATRLGRDRVLTVLCRIDGISILVLLSAVLLGFVPTIASWLAFTSIFFQSMLVAARSPNADLEFLCDAVADAEWSLWPVFLGVGFLVSTTL